MTLSCRFARDPAALLAIALAIALASPGAPLRAADAVPEPTELSAEGLALFQAQVAPLLKQHCVKCHGGAKTQAEFDLTTRESLLRGGEDGTVIVPGKSSESRLYKLIAHAEEPNMPEEAPKLPDEAIAHIAHWIDLGAPYDQPLVEKSASPVGSRVVTDADRQFWSFRPLAAVVPPACRNEAWCRTPVDRFVLGALESHAIGPNGETDKRRLLRRATFDLIGLPPTPEEVDAFEKDASADAYPKAIDRLLASPHYGERWGRHWLDLARFAESHGYEQDYDRPAAYHYRDFVIRALNDDMPFDRFVRLQIAGDELEPDNPQALLATGFLGAGTHATQITANQVEKERYDELDDMAATVGTAMLGLTIGCARCHDHKFDPLPQADYYRFISTFTTTVRSEIDLDLTPGETKKAREPFDREHAPLVEALARFERDELPPRVDAWLAAGGKLPDVKWLVLEALSLKSQGGANFARLDDGSYLASGNNAQFDTYTFEAQTTLQGVTAIRLEALADNSMVGGGPGRAGNGNFALTDFRVTAAPLGADAQPVPVKLVRPQATFEQNNVLAVAAAIDDNKTSGWAVDPQFGKNHAAVFEFETPLGDARGLSLSITLKFENNAGHNIGRPRLSITTAASPVGLDGQQAAEKQTLEVRRIVALPAGERSAEQRAVLVSWYRATDPQWQQLKQAVDEHARLAPLPKLIKAQITSEGLPPIRFHTQGADFFEKTFYLKRGDLNQKVAEAPAGFLQVLSRSGAGDAHWQQPSPAGSRLSHRRAALARWLTDVDAGAGPTVARVIVNRLWQHHFGRGLVATPSDFGAQGERPTHPELLDWLAGELVRGGWQLKPIHRLLMNSSVYRQNNDYDDARAAVDPDNKLCWHRSRRRLEAEIIRDSIYSVSGLLDESLYGPGSLDEAQRRRSIYFTIKRSQLVPLMVLFDAPEPLQAVAERSSTTIAPQALALLNNARLREAAVALAGRVSAADQQAAEPAVRLAYRRALAREPDSVELAAALEFVASQLRLYQAAGKVEPERLALADFCQALLSLNEFVFVE